MFYYFVQYSTPVSILASVTRLIDFAPARGNSVGGAVDQDYLNPSTHQWRNQGVLGVWVWMGAKGPLSMFFVLFKKIFSLENDMFLEAGPRVGKHERWR
jgi:hypothetical protein